MTIYSDPKQLLASIYEGSNVANKDKRDKSKQKANFPAQGLVFNLDLFGEFLLENDLVGSLGKSLINHIIRTYNKPALEQVLKANPALANWFCFGEQHPLLKAALMGSQEMVEILLKYGANPNDLAHKTQADSSKYEKVLNMLSGTTSHETVAMAVAAIKPTLTDDKKAIANIKKMISSASQELERARAEQTASVTARVVENFVDYEDSSAVVKFSDEGNSSDHSPGHSAHGSGSLDSDRFLEGRYDHHSKQRAGKGDGHK